LSEQLDRHLKTVARTMGGFLRGFENPRLHTGSADLFIREFRKVLVHPALHLPDGNQVVSYAAAAGSYRVPADVAAAAEPDNPISVLVRGLNESAPFSAHARHILHPVPLRADLAALLRLPALLFYLQVTDTAVFFARLAKIAEQEAFPLAAGSSESLAAAGYCPACRSKWSPGTPSSGIQRCACCGKALEVVRSLPLVSGVGCMVSYELLRRMVALDLVVSYQEEGNIRTLQPGSTIS
jgi:hypothetical protein